MQIEAIDCLIGSPEDLKLGVVKFQLSQINSELFDAAQAELQSVINQENDGDKCWGYFPQHPDKEFISRYDLPKCKKLEAEILGYLKKFPVFESLQTSFIRMSNGLTYRNHGGLHLDVDAGSAYVGDADNYDGSAYIIKIALNAHRSEGRAFFYLDTPIPELREKFGIDYSYTEYRPLPLEAVPEGLEVKSGIIPPRTDTHIYANVFIANRVPHSGNDRDDGHFLLAFAAYSKKNLKLTWKSL